MVEMSQIFQALLLLAKTVVNKCSKKKYSQNVGKALQNYRISSLGYQCRIQGKFGDIIFNWNAL